MSENYINHIIKENNILKPNIFFKNILNNISIFSSNIRNFTGKILKFIENEFIIIQFKKSSLPVLHLIQNITKLDEYINKLDKIHSEKVKMDVLQTLAAGIAHTFNNILFVITGYTEMMLSEVNIDPVSKDYLQNILKAAERAKSQINKIILLSAQNKERFTLINSKSIIKNILYHIKKIIPEGITISENIDNDLFIMGIHSQIYIVIENICMNSIESIQKDGKIEISASNSIMNENPYIKLSISDNGCGIDKNIKGKIFDPYFTTKELGRGLGLSVVYGIMKTHKGHIEFESEKEKGTTFNLYFPKPL
ncbi:MAG: hypothetical protein HQK76_10555 [Desulfobacterales bacterium]|nr:hypothetical protein [Desulfobacterales bacterium]